MWVLFQLPDAGEDMRVKGFGVGGTFFRKVIGFARQVGQRARQLLNLDTSLWLVRDLCQTQTLRHRLPSGLA